MALIVFLVGLALMVAGTALIFIPAGLIVAGLLLAYFASAFARSAPAEDRQ